MRNRIFVATFAVFLLAAAASAQSADDAARRAIDVLAGPAWDNSRYFAFTFNVEREGTIARSFPQQWDRFTGDYRVSGKDRDGADILVIMNVNTKQGKAWKNGAEVAAPSELLKFGYGRFINDTFWLLMGFKSFDPGVSRTYEGEKTDACGERYDVVRFNFDNVGLTPGDVYWMWVNKDTGLVDEWHMKLQGSKPEDEPGVVLFHDYRRYNGLMISSRREMKGRNTNIRLDDIVVASAPPPGAFVK